MLSSCPAASGGSADASKSAAQGSERLSLDEINSFVSQQFLDSLRESRELEPLGFDAISAAFFKKLECKLNRVIWDMYRTLCTKQDAAVQVNLTPGAKPGKDTVQVILPPPDGLQLPFVHRLTTSISRSPFGAAKSSESLGPLGRCFLLRHVCSIGAFESLWMCRSKG